MELEFKFSAQDIISQGRTTRKNIDLIKEWNSKMEYKCIPILTDELVTIFLLSCTNDIDKTKKTIEKYYKIKLLSPAIFDDRDMESEDFKLTVNTSALSPVYWKEENTVIIYCKLIDTDYRNCYMEPHVKCAIMSIDSVYYENPLNDLIIVQDVKGLGLMHLTRIKIHSLKIFFNYIQEALPIKLRAVHYINSNYALNKFMVISKLLIDPELYKKIHFHCGPDDLYQFIPKDYIPSNYGGDTASVEDLQKGGLQKLKDMEPFWKAEEAMRKDCSTSDSL